MQLLRDCSTSYTLPQARAKLAATMLRELSHAQIQVRALQLGWREADLWGTSRQLVWRLVFAILPGGNETRKKRAPARLRQRELPHIPPM